MVIGKLSLRVALPCSFFPLLAHMLKSYSLSMFFVYVPARLQKYHTAPDVLNSATSAGP